jgi:isopenicillin N synthase-like dioxygenase
LEISSKEFLAGTCLLDPPASRGGVMGSGTSRISPGVVDPSLRKPSAAPAFMVYQNCEQCLKLAYRRKDRALTEHAMVAMIGRISPVVEDAPKDDDETVRLMDYPDSTEEIPLLDIAPFLAGEPGAREAIAAQLREITETVGFFYLKGHGIERSLIDRVFEQSRRFHGLPHEAKEAVGYVINDTFRSGYRSGKTDRPARSNSRIISGAKPNLLSQFGINREPTPAQPGTEQPASVNLWPEGLPGFREPLLAYHARIEALARSFLPLWATGLDLPIDYFEPFFRSPHLTLQLIHYPPQTEIGNRQYGVAPHTDNSLMTFLAQATVPGLAVQMPSGHWRVADVIPDTLMVNTGNLMVRWTNDYYLSTKHRVINTATVDRYSIAAFFGPSSDALLECLPTCCSADRPARYEPITYGDLRKWYYDYAG